MTENTVFLAADRPIFRNSGEALPKFLNLILVSILHCKRSRRSEFRSANYFECTKKRNADSSAAVNDDGIVFLFDFRSTPLFCHCSFIPTSPIESIGIRERCHSRAITAHTLHKRTKFVFSQHIAAAVRACSLVCLDAWCGGLLGFMDDTLYHIAGRCARDVCSRGRSPRGALFGDYLSYFRVVFGA